MRDFVRQQHEAAEHDAWLRRQVQMGLDSANAGELLGSEEVEAEAAAWRAEISTSVARRRRILDISLINQPQFIIQPHRQTPDQQATVSQYQRLEMT